jgi:hypothetical protein
MGEDWQCGFQVVPNTPKRHPESVVALNFDRKIAENDFGLLKTFCRYNFKTFY